MTRFERLKQEALDACYYRDHEMSEFVTSGVNGEWSYHATSTCVVCGMTVAVTPKPAPNDIDIGGEAVALNCTGDGRG